MIKSFNLHAPCAPCASERTGRKPFFLLMSVVLVLGPRYSLVLGVTAKEKRKKKKTKVGSQAKYTG